MPNWRKLKNEYMAGDMSYKTLAAKHGVSLSTLSKTAQKEGWSKARQKYRNKLATKTADALCARACAREVNRLEALENAAMGTAAMLEQVLEDPEQFYRHLVVKSVAGVGSNVEERTFKKLDMKAIREYTAALQTMTATMRNLYGLPTAPEQSAMEIAMERLKLDQRKAAMGEVDESQTGVLEVAAVLEEASNDDA